MTDFCECECGKVGCPSAPASLPETATVNPNGTVTYPLLWPITFTKGGSEVVIDEVTVRRKRIDDNLAIKATKYAADVAHELIVRLCDIDPKAAKLMDEADGDAIAMIIDSFTTPGQPTGSSASA